MNREEAIQYLIDAGISPEHTMEIVESINQEPCDAVSRKAAIDACLKGLNRKEMVSSIKDLPSVQPKQRNCDTCKHYGALSLECGRCNDECSQYEPKQRMGRWKRKYIRPNVYADLFWYCSACGDKCGYNNANLFEYCPHCGAKMEVEE